MFPAQVLILMQTQRLMKSVNYVKLNYVYKFNNFPRWTLSEMNSTAKNISVNGNQIRKNLTHPVISKMCLANGYPCPNSKKLD